VKKESKTMRNDFFLIFQINFSRVLSVLFFPCFCYIRPLIIVIILQQLISGEMINIILNGPTNLS
jgi:hypothetical protein